MLPILLAAAAQSVTLSANNYVIDEPMPAHLPNLLWSDEFDGPSLDQTKLEFRHIAQQAGLVQRGAGILFR